MISEDSSPFIEINMKANLVKFSKRKNFFGALEAEWANLFQGRAQEDEDIDELFEEKSPKKRRALELSSSFSGGGGGAGGSTSKAGLEAIASLNTFTKKAEKDIALASYNNDNSAPSAQKRTKTHPSKVEYVNEWYQQVLKYGQSGSVGLVPEPWQSKFPLPASSKLQLVKGATLDILEHYAQWRERKN